MKKTLASILACALVLVCFAVFAVTASADEAGYVTNGLVANYDGSKIADNATTWTDASGNGNDIVNLPNTDANYFKDGAYHLNSITVDLPDAIDTAVGGDEFTVELAIDNVQSFGVYWNTFINCPSDDFSLFRSVPDDTLVVKLSSNERPKSAASAGLNLLSNATVSVTFKAGGKSRLYVNGELVSEVACAAKLPNASGMFFGHDNSNKNYSADFKAMRFYNRELTADEIKANYAVDIAEKEPVEDSSDSTSSDSSSDETTATTTTLVNVALNKTYTMSPLFRAGGAEVNWGWDPNAAVAYPDEDDKTLTDGVIDPEADDFHDAVFMGFNKNAPEYAGTEGEAGLGYAWLTVDLGEETAVKKLVLYTGGSALGEAAGIKAPASVEFFVSDDSETWTSVGMATLGDATKAVVPATLELKTAASAQYVQARVVAGSSWIFVSEFEAYAESETPSESSTPTESSSEAPSESTSSTPTTADSGVLSLVLIAFLAAAGAVVAAKVR